MTSDGYKFTFGRESSSGLGVKVSLQLPEGQTLSEQDGAYIGTVADKLYFHLRDRLDATDSQEIKYRAKERENLLALFGDAKIFVESIPNEYTRSVAGRPWFRVWTRIGPIKVGWRKRVIVVDWSAASLPLTAEELFPHDGTTKDGRMIHAWGYDRARDYVTMLLSSE